MGLCLSTLATEAAPVWTADRLDALWHQLQTSDNTAPRAELQLGGIIKLTSQGCIFNPAPLLDHSWLQGRMSPAEWRELIMSLNNCALALLAGTEWKNWTAMQSLDSVPLTSINAAMDAKIAQLQPTWRERGINIEYTHAKLQGFYRVSTLFFVVQPQSAAMPIALAAAPPEYAVEAESAEGEAAPLGVPAAPGGPFVDVIKPTANTEPAGAALSSSAVSIPASALRFCPLCAAPVAPATAGKRFCPDCGGAWR